MYHVKIENDTNNKHSNTNNDKCIMSTSKMLKHSNLTTILVSPGLSIVNNKIYVQMEEG